MSGIVGVVNDAVEIGDEKSKILKEPEVVQDDNGDQADNIASNLIGFLVNAFKNKEGRDPNAEEVEELLSELTEKRINEMLGMDHVPSGTAEGNDVVNSPGKDITTIVVNDSTEVKKGEDEKEEDNVDGEKDGEVKENKEESKDGEVADSLDSKQEAKQPAFVFSWPVNENVIPEIGNKRALDAINVEENNESAKKPAFEFNWPIAAAP